MRTAVRYQRTLPTCGVFAPHFDERGLSPNHGVLPEAETPSVMDVKEVSDGLAPSCVSGE